MSELTDKDLEILKHMLGATPPSRKKSWGYRNHFCSSGSGPEHDALVKMKGMGLVTQFEGRKGSPFNGQTFFYCTEAGCKAAGLHNAAIKRALED